MVNSPERGWIPSVRAKTLSFFSESVSESILAHTPSVEFWFFNPEWAIPVCYSSLSLKSRGRRKKSGPFSSNQNKNEESKKGRILRQERYAGSCSRSFYVGDVKPEEIRAKYEFGVLTVLVPKEDVKKSPVGTAIAIE